MTSLEIAKLQLFVELARRDQACTKGEINRLQGSVEPIPAALTKNEDLILMLLAKEPIVLETVKRADAEGKNLGDLRTT